MPRITKTAEHLTTREIDDKIKASPTTAMARRWMIIRHALVSPAKAEDIARHIGVATQTVHNLISKYNRLGAVAVETKGKGRPPLSEERLTKEREFLETLKAEAAKGAHTTVRNVKSAWEKLTGCSIGRSSVYRMVYRHTWRKVAPRPRHVDSDAAEQDNFKKTSGKTPKKR